MKKNMGENEIKSTFELILKSKKEKNSPINKISSKNMKFITELAADGKLTSENAKELCKCAGKDKKELSMFLKKEMGIKAIMDVIDEYNNGENGEDKVMNFETPRF